MFDSFDRQISSLRISVTDKCNLRCRYCMPEGGVPARSHREFLSFEKIVEVARAAVGLGITKVRLTGGEPLVKRGIVELVRMLRAIEGLQELALTTNGILLPSFAHGLRAAGLDRLNISLDSLDPARYAEITRGGDLGQALAGVRAALAEGFPVKINMVVLEDTPEQEIARMRAWAESAGAKLQLIQHYSLRREKADSYRFDRPASCADCNRIRLMADGMLKPCLHSDREVQLDFSRLEECLREAILAKPEKGGVCTNRAMSQIGG
jgi:cyclic pyranopterin phosphate synthase